MALRFPRIPRSGPPVCRCGAQVPERSEIGSEAQVARYGPDPNVGRSVSSRTQIFWSKKVTFEVTRKNEVTQKNAGHLFRKTSVFKRGEWESNPRVTDLQSVALATWLSPRFYQSALAKWVPVSDSAASEIYTECIGRWSTVLKSIPGENLRTPNVIESEVFHRKLRI